MYLYIITFPNSKKYIGITKNSLEARKREHKSQAKRNNKQLVYRAIRKYGWDSLIWSYIECNCSLEQLRIFERILIKQFKTLNDRYGYNLSSGGESGNDSIRTKETKSKISSSLKGKRPWNKGKTISYVQQGENSHASKLTRLQVEQICFLYNDFKGFSIRELAKSYKLSYASVYDIVHFKSYK